MLPAIKYVERLGKKAEEDVKNKKCACSKFLWSEN